MFHEFEDHGDTGYLYILSCIQIKTIFNQPDLSSESHMDNQNSDNKRIQKQKENNLLKLPDIEHIKQPQITIARN